MQERREGQKLWDFMLAVYDLPDVAPERVRPQGHLRGLRGCTAATVPYDIHPPLRVINPTLNIGGRPVEGPAGASATVALP